MYLLAALLAGALLLGAQTDHKLSPNVVLLAKIRSRMIWNLHRQPNYTCVETIERTHRDSPAGKFELLDTLRLEVALVDGQETFGWPGAKSFEYTDLRRIVSQGAFGNGNFANHARAIFEGPFAQFDYRGETTIDGRDAVRFNYHIPLLGSGYNLRVEKHQATVAYHGAIYADPHTFDVERIEVNADEIPAELGLAGATDRMDYARVPIGGGDFLLPDQSELTMTDLTGGANRNQVRFASCREFTGQSELAFTGAVSNVKAVAAVREIVVPSGIGLALRMAADLDTRTAAVGDPVRARLDQDIKQKGRILFLKGACVLGRITRMEHRGGSVIAGLDFSEIEGDGARAAVRLKLENVASREFLDPQPGPALPAAQPGEGIIPLGAGHFQLNRGTLMYWRTD